LPLVIKVTKILVNKIKTYRRVLTICLLVTGIYFLFPPYTVQSSLFFVLNSEELNVIDKSFFESSQERLPKPYKNLFPIFKTENDTRVYYIGSIRRFGKVYKVAYSKGREMKAYCSPSLFYFKEKISCDIPLNSEWFINYFVLEEKIKN